LRELSIAADHRNLFSNGLRYGNAVSYVFVIFDERQFGECPQVSDVDAFYHKAQFFGNIVNDILGGFPQFDAEFSRLPQKYQFLHAFGRNVYVVAGVFENSLNFRSEFILISGAEVKDIRVDIIAFGSHRLNTFQTFGSGGMCAFFNHAALLLDTPPLLLAKSSVSATELSLLAFRVAESFREAFIFLTAVVAKTSTSARVTVLNFRHSASLSSLSRFRSGAALTGFTAAADRFLTAVAAADTFLAGFTAVFARRLLFVAIFIFRSLGVVVGDIVTVLNIIDGRLLSQVKIFTYYKSFNQMKGECGMKIFTVTKSGRTLLLAAVVAVGSVSTVTALLALSAVGRSVPVIYVYISHFNTIN
jgi:hypothetical protein